MVGLLLRFVLDPVAAGHLAAFAIGYPELGDELARVCRRESRCLPLGIHPNDASASNAVWRNAMRSGVLDPHCPWHWRDVANWSTSGAWGAMRGFTWGHIGAPCMPVEVIDVPIVGAFAVAYRMEAACDRFGACDEISRGRLWSGAGIVDRLVARLRRFTGTTAIPWREDS